MEMTSTPSQEIRESQSNIDIVRFLVEKGADINRLDNCGITCLMNSVHSVERCHFLIQQRTLMNAVDNNGNLALYHAILFDWFHSVQLLMEHGADTSICNKFGDDALRTTALCIIPLTLEYLIQQMKPTSKRCADVYWPLAATTTVDKNRSAQEALPHWIKSASI